MKKKPKSSSFDRLTAFLRRFPALGKPLSTGVDDEKAWELDADDDDEE